jgi:hypothetical protein
MLTFMDGKSTSEEVLVGERQEVLVGDVCDGLDAQLVDKVNLKTVIPHRRSRCRHVRDTISNF